MSFFYVALIHSLTDVSSGICQFDYYEQNTRAGWTNQGMWLLRQVSATQVAEHCIRGEHPFSFFLMAHMHRHSPNNAHTQVHKHTSTHAHASFSLLLKW